MNKSSLHVSNSKCRLLFIGGKSSINEMNINKSKGNNVSARTLCHYFAVILSMRHDKKNAKHGNNTIIQKPAIKAGLTFGVSIIGARINMLQPRPGDAPLKVGNNGQDYQVVSY